jgi:hypothetical protein
MYANGRIGELARVTVSQTAEVESVVVINQFTTETSTWKLEKKGGKWIVKRYELVDETRGASPFTLAIWDCDMIHVWAKANGWISNPPPVPEEAMKEIEN